MSNIHQIHLQSKRQQSVLEAQRLEQACEWIARIDRELQTEEKQALQQWLAASALNQQTLFEVAKLWDKMDALSQTKAGGGMGRAYTRMGNLPSLDAAGKLSAGKVATATGAVGQDIWAYLRKQGGRLATKVGLQSRQRLVTLAAKLPEGKTL